ncbi:alpha-1,6-mannosyltransferase [Nocardioides scoriae]|uniref:Alpha-1,6-mannosyltransferase n=1 Tax=Nocardioides scoriae TaxID=642780 RepID=A0A1H1TKM5_9ACTN|nr:alpha-1,6-mannosyltransferase [Nocardioides scoriae]
MGSLLVLVASLLTPWAATTSLRMAALLVVLTGLGLLGSAWLALCAAAARGEADLAVVRRAVVWWSAPLVLAPPLFSRDGWSYVAQGLLTHLDLSPYVWTPSVLDGPAGELVDPMWRWTPTPYGPVPLLWGDLVADLTSEPHLLLLGYRLLALLGLALLVWALPRLARWDGVDPARAAALALPSPLLVAHGVGGLHHDLLVVGLVAAALVLARRHGWLLGSVVAGLALAVKLPGVLACVGVALVTLPVAAPLAARLARLAASGLVAGLVVVLAGVPRGLGLGWVEALGVPGVVLTPLSAPAMLGLLVGEVDAVRLVAQLLAVGLVLAVALRTPTGSPAAALRATVLALLAVLVLSPAVHLWYLLWVLPLAAALRMPARLRLLTVVLGLVGGLAAPLDSSLHGLYLVVLGGTAAFALLTAALLGAPAHRLRVAAAAGQAVTVPESRRPG